MLALPAWAVLGGLATASALASLINTMAGGGSLLLIPMMLAAGIPPTVANGTLRVSVIATSVTAIWTFRRRGIVEFPTIFRLAIPMMLGAGLGTAIATRLSDDVLRPVFGVLLAVWAVWLLVRPTSFLAEREPRPWDAGGLVWAGLVGVYGGFAQAGVGFPLLALLVVRHGVPPVRANAIKMGLVLAYTCVSLPVFAAAGQVAWREGATLAIGAVVGAWLGSRWQIRSGAAVVRWFVVVMVALSGLAMLTARWW